MRIVKIKGGLGNQMFQYAFARELEFRRGEQVFLDISSYEYYELHNGFELDRVFAIEGRFADEAEARRLGTPADTLFHRLRRKYLPKATHFIDRKFAFDPAIFDDRGDLYYEGYWQSERFFEGVRDEIRGSFAFKLPLRREALELVDSMPRPRCSLHVRRGDYLRDPLLDFSGSAYLKGALRRLQEATALGSLVVFSDDLAWCREELREVGVPICFVEGNRGLDSWQDMALMASCEHNVIANSSFSWWGAWLNPNPGKIVIAPALWNPDLAKRGDRYYRFSYDDVVPEGWIKIGNEHA